MNKRLTFHESVKIRRAASPAYDSGYRACLKGEPMDCLKRDSTFRSAWYSGWLDAKYPEDKYEMRKPT